MAEAFFRLSASRKNVEVYDKNVTGAPVKQGMVLVGISKARYLPREVVHTPIGCKANDSTASASAPDMLLV